MNNKISLGLILIIAPLFSAFRGPAEKESESNALASFVSPIIIRTSATTPRDIERAATNILFQSKDSGQTWQDISYSLPENQQPEDFFAGKSDVHVRVNDVSYRSKSGLTIPVWEKEADLDWKQVRDEAVMNIVESEGVLIGTSQKGIMRSTDNGENWQLVISEGGVGIAVECIKGGFAAIAYNTTIKSRRVHISMDGGKTWKAIDAGLRPSLSISSIKQMGNYLICGHPDGIFRSSDMGKTWDKVHPSVDNVFKTSFNASPGKVFKIYVSGNVLYAVASSAGC